MHLISNVAVCCLCGPAVGRILLRGSATATASTPPMSESTMDALAVTCALHAYHFASFRLTAIHVVHHFTSLIALLLCVWPRPCSDQAVVVVLVACSGAPGAVEYATLLAVAAGWVHKLQQKRLSAWINMLLRCPLGVVGSWIAFVEGASRGSVCTILFSLITFLNATLFAKMAVENHCAHCRVGIAV